MFKLYYLNVLLIENKYYIQFIKIIHTIKIHKSQFNNLLCRNPIFFKLCSINKDIHIFKICTFIHTFLNIKHYSNFIGNYFK